MIIRIFLSQSIGRTEGSNDNRGLFDKVACANSKVYVKRKYITKELKMFIDGFNGCCSTVSAKKRNLQKQGDKRIPVYDQGKTVLCNFLEQKTLGVVDTDTTENESCESLVGRFIQSLLFLRKNLGYCAQRWRQ